MIGIVVKDLPPSPARDLLLRLIEENEDLIEEYREMGFGMEVGREGGDESILLLLLTQKVGELEDRIDALNRGEWS